MAGTAGGGSIRHIHIRRRHYYYYDWHRGRFATRDRLGSRLRRRYNWQFPAGHGGGVGWYGRWTDDPRDDDSRDGGSRADGTAGGSGAVVAFHLSGVGHCPTRCPIPPEGLWSWWCWWCWHWHWREAGLPCVVAVVAVIVAVEQAVQEREEAVAAPTPLRRVLASPPAPRAWPPGQACHGVGKIRDVPP